MNRESNAIFPVCECPTTFLCQVWSCLTSVGAGEYYGEIPASGGDGRGEEAGER